MASMLASEKRRYFGQMADAVLEFLAFARRCDLPTSEELLAGTQYNAPKEPDIMYAVATALAYAVQRNPTPERAERALEVLDEFPMGIVAVSVGVIVRAMVAAGGKATPKTVKLLERYKLLLDL